MRIRNHLLILVVMILPACMQVIDAPKGSKRPTVYGPSERNGKSAAEIINDAAQSLADQVAADIADAGPDQVIAVQRFLDQTGRAGPIADSLNASFRNKLFLATNVVLLADEDMQRALKSTKIQQRLSAAMDPSTAIEFSKKTGASAFIDGKITDLISDFLVSLDFVHIETGQLWGSAEVKIPKNVLYSF